MKKISFGTLVLLLPVLAILTGLTALPAVCLAQEKLSVTMSLNKGPVIQAGDSLAVTLAPSGGRPPYTYWHDMYIYEQDVAYGYFTRAVPDSSHTWAVGFGDSVKLVGMVQDADDTVAACETTLEVQGSVYNPLMFTGHSLSPGDVINVGDTLTYSIDAQGGQPPYSYSYKLDLVQYDHSQSDCWSVPVYIGDYSCSSSSLSYTVTRGTKGYISGGVQDAAGRRVYHKLPLSFAILGDDHAPMDLSATHSIQTLKTDSILGNNKYRLTVQASVKAGTPPIRFFCMWRLYKDGACINQVNDKNGDGMFTLEGNFHAAEAILWAIDGDEWETRSLSINFGPSKKGILFPFGFERVRINPLGISLGEDVFGPVRGDLAAQLYEFLGMDPSPDPFLDATIPELARPGLIRPEATEPVTTGSEIARPGLLQPLKTTSPLLPVQQLPSLPRP
ncbi:MAG: hypothetical protein ACOX62_04975 [Christensenellales bacterium]|jgi:hypothetical protein